MKVPVQEIIFKWKEGSSSLSREIELGRYNCASWSKADETLAKWAKDVTQDDGYDKLGFKIVWEGNSYEGTYDIKWGERPSLARQVVTMLKYLKDYSKDQKEREESAIALRTLDFGLEIKEICGRGRRKA